MTKSGILLSRDLGRLNRAKDGAMMSSNTGKNTGGAQNVASLVAGLLIGITFLASGTGKVAGFEETPAQVVGFITSIVPEIFLTPLTISFLYKIFIPYIMPCAELILGLLLIIGFMPRLIAILCLPLLVAFMGTNAWSIAQGGYTECASCFGIWEKMFGSLTPVQSLMYDLVLFALALMVIVLYHGGFFSSRSRLTAFARKHKPAVERMKLVLHSWSNLRDVVAAPAKRLVKAVRQRPRFAAGATIGIIGLALVVYGVTVLYLGTGISGRQESSVEPVISTVSISDVSERSAAISWTTDKPTISIVQLYSEGGVLITERIDNEIVTNHRLLIDGLSSSTLYYYEIVPGDTAPSLTLSKQYHFTTQAVATKLLISNVRVSETKEAGVTIIWTTNKPATSEVEYWVSGSPEKSMASDNELTWTHSMSLSALNPEAVYSFRVKSTDDTGNKAVSEKDGTFTLATGAEIGKRAPDFTLPSLDGKTITLSNYRGKMVMLDFWIWTCSGCRKKMTIAQEALDKISEETTAILCIHVEGRTSAIHNYALSEKLTVPILLDLEGTVAERYKVTGFPTVFFLDGDGIVRLRDADFNTAEELLHIFSTMSSSTQNPRSQSSSSLKPVTACCS